MSANPQFRCEPSQNGLFDECPQRHKLKVVRPARPNARPSGSTSSKSPSMRMDPLWFTVILVAAIFSPEKSDGQYLGTDGSTSSDHASIPPLRFKVLRNPALRRKSTASAERLPLRQ